VSLSAVSLVAGMSLLAPGWQGFPPQASQSAVLGKPLRAEADAVSDAVGWSALKPSLLMVRTDGVVRGVAGLIDARGLYVVSRYAVRGNRIDAVDYDGQTVKVSLLKVDELSDLALIQRDTAVTGSQAFEPASEIKVGELVYAVLPDGMFRVELSSSELIGVSSERRRTVPVIRIALEQPEQNYETALFVRGFRFYGGLSSVQTELQQSAPTIRDKRYQQGFLNQSQFAPGLLTVGYMTSPTLSSRVVRGFRSPNRVVAHPYLGCICRDSLSGGAELVVVEPGSAAERAGLRVGDVVVRLGDYSVRNQYEYARAMFKQVPNTELRIDFFRQGVRRRTTAVVGTLAD